MSLSERLVSLRLKKNQSLQEVADAMGVSKTHIWELEKGRTENPSLETLTKLANHFDVTIRFLIGEEIESSQDEGLLSMFRKVSKLGDPDRQVLDATIEAMLKRSKGGDD